MHIPYPHLDLRQVTVREPRGIVENTQPNQQRNGQDHRQTRYHDDTSTCPPDRRLIGVHGGCVTRGVDKLRARDVSPYAS